MWLEGWHNLYLYCEGWKFAQNPLPRTTRSKFKTALPLFVDAVINYDGYQAPNDILFLKHKHSPPPLRIRPVVILLIGEKSQLNSRVSKRASASSSGCRCWCYWLLYINFEAKGIHHKQVEISLLCDCGKVGQSCLWRFAGKMEDHKGLHLQLERTKLQRLKGFNRAKSKVPLLVPFRQRVTNVSLYPVDFFAPWKCVRAGQVSFGESLSGKYYSLPSISLSIVYGELTGDNYSLPKYTVVFKWPVHGSNGAHRASRLDKGLGNK